MTDRKDFKIIQPFEGGRYDDGFQTNSVSGQPLISLHGKNKQEKYAKQLSTSLQTVKMDDDILSKHVLVVGGIGMGKTNLLKTMVKQLSVTEYNNVFLFDTKGDYHQEFGYLGGYCIGKAGETDPMNIWNIFEELKNSDNDNSDDEDSLYELTNEMASMMFAEHIKHSTQSFFPIAAKTIFAAVLRAIHRIKMGNSGILTAKPSNLLLKRFFNGEEIFNVISMDDDPPGLYQNLIRLLMKDEKERNALSYISTDTEKGGQDGQTLGVLSTLKLVVDELFVGQFGQEGSFSMINTMREGGKKCVFLEYDIRKGGVLAPIYSLLTDLAIKETLRNRLPHETVGNSYFVIDEFKLLPHLTHMDDAVNFGRSQGMKFVIGIQNISQIKENYGEEGAMNILSGFSTVIAFKVSDFATREYLVRLFGENRKRTAYLSAVKSRGVIETLERGNVVEDWDIRSLQVGECIIRLAATKRDSMALDAKNDPFFFATAPYASATYTAPAGKEPTVDDLTTAKKSSASSITIPKDAKSIDANALIAALSRMA